MTQSRNKAGAIPKSLAPHTHVETREDTGDASHKNGKRERCMHVEWKCANLFFRTKFSMIYMYGMAMISHDIHPRTSTTRHC